MRNWSSGYVKRVVGVGKPNPGVDNTAASACLIAIPRELPVTTSLVGNLQTAE